MHWLRNEGILADLADLAELGINPSDIGTPRVFANALLNRLERSMLPSLRVHAVTNVRFANEVASLREHCAERGYKFVHALVVVGNTELRDRRIASGYDGTYDGGVSEEYARRWSEIALCTSTSLFTHAPEAPEFAVFNEAKARHPFPGGCPSGRTFADAHAFAAHVRSLL
jgi:hypothetical protein